jgi:Mat/Ecp fimbriae outer membrane usher protein
MKSPYLYGAMALICTPVVFADDVVSQIRIGQYKLPSLLSQTVIQGLSVPIYVKLDEDAQLQNAKSKQKIAEATVVYRDGQLHIDQIQFEDANETTELSKQVQEELSKLKAAFDDDLNIQVTSDAKLKLDLQALYLELFVTKQALGTAYIARKDILAASTSDKISSVFNYRLGTSYNNNNGVEKSSSYLNLDSTTSFREHHLLVNGSVYGLGDGNTSADLYRAMYERDYEGNRFAVGMMDTWSMQSIASLNALNTSKVYGMTYGNKSNTVIHDNAQSLVPIVVFLPSAGTVQLYRDGRLISIQNFSMGSHEIDTSGFPFGVYNVEVRTFINGEQISSTIAQVNKTQSRTSSETGVLDWQVFGGMLEYSARQKTYSKNKNNENTWLMGVALAKSYPVLSGLNVRSTLYAFDENVVTEVEGNLSLPWNTSINAQTMLASDSSYKTSLALNYTLPKGFGSIWAARSRSEMGKTLNFTEINSYDLGLSFNLKQLYDKLGYLSTSYSEDIERKGSTLSVEYLQNLFSLKYADVSFRTGMQKSNYEDQKSYNDKYIFFDLKLPFSKWFGAGLSSRNNNLLATANYKQTFDNSVITNVGADVSQVIDRKNYDTNTDDFMASAYLGYEAKYNTGTISVNGSRNSYSANYTTQGAIATSGANVALGNKNINSGVIINTGLKDQGSMSALINGQDFTLTGGRNFIPLSPYKEYSVELLNNKNTVDTVTIGKGRKSKIVLYPGNVSLIQPDVKQMVTIFGHIYDQEGHLITNKTIQTNIGKSRIDDQGEFSIDIDKRYPKLIMLEENKPACEVDVDIDKARGAVWLGNLTCVTKAGLKTFQELDNE